MTLHWTFTYDGEPQQFNLSELGREIMPVFGLEESDYKVFDDHIDGTPQIHVDRWVTPVRFSVYGIKLRPRKDESSVCIEIKLYKLYVMPLLLVAFVFALNGLSGWFIALTVYILVVVIFGILTLASLYDSKNTVEKKIKTFANIYYQNRA